MINSVSISSQRSNVQYKPNVLSFNGGNTLGRYVKPVNTKHINLLDKIGEFFTGVSEMLKAQQKTLATQSGSLNVKNIAEPIPEAVIQFDKFKSLTIKPKKFRLEGSRDALNLCHFEYFDPPKLSKFDIVLTDSPKSVKKGDIFAFDFHRADKHPIRDNEAESVNKLFDRYSDDIQSIIRKYQKKLS